jgi:hypothetical protein
MRNLGKATLLLGLSVVLAACSAATPPGTVGVTSTALLPTVSAGTATATLDPDLPITDAGVPRVAPEKAKRAFEAGDAIIVDVRTAEEYARKHVAVAILVPFADIDQNPTGVPLDKAKWIITYCT